MFKQWPLTQADYLRGPMLMAVEMGLREVETDGDRLSLHGSGGSDDSGCGHSSEESARTGRIQRRL